MNLSINKRRTGGFTLVELLMVVAIIAILSTLSLAVMRSTQEDARKAATQARMTQATAILSLYIEDFEFRRLPFRLSDLREFVILNPIMDNTKSTPEPIRENSQLRNLRYRILADYVNVEMPRFPSGDPLDIALNVADLGQFPSPLFETWLNAEYSTVNGNGLSLVAFLQTYPTSITKRWELISRNNLDNNGELLFELFGMIEFLDQNGLESMGSRSIGDSDDDGRWEIVDSWGNSLDFSIRQIAVLNPPPLDDRWTDDPLGISIPLDVRIPRKFHHFRFDIWSDNVARLPQY